MRIVSPFGRFQLVFFLTSVFFLKFQTIFSSEISSHFAIFLLNGLFPVYQCSQFVNFAYLIIYGGLRGAIGSALVSNPSDPWLLIQRSWVRATRCLRGVTECGLGRAALTLALPGAGRREERWRPEVQVLKAIFNSMYLYV